MPVRSPHYFQCRCHGRSNHCTQCSYRNYCAGGAGGDRGISDPNDRQTSTLGAVVSAGHFRFGVTGRNLMKPEFEAAEGPIAMRRQVRVGAALVPRSLPSGVHGPFSLAFDLDLTETSSVSGDIRMAALGTEYWLVGGRVGVRAGVRWSTLNVSQRAISGGLTVRLPRSTYFEGQVTKPAEASSRNGSWGCG